MAERLRSSGRMRALSGVALSVLVAAALWTTVTWSAAYERGFQPVQTKVWSRWDSGLYEMIAADGYTFEHCNPDAGYPPDSWCGTAGWFPLLPYAAVAMSQLGPPTQAAMRGGVLVAFIAMLTAAALGSLRERSRSSALLAMCLLGVFPGSVYFGALFPISLALAGVFGCLAAIRRRWWLTAGGAAAVATMAYPSGVLVVVVALVVLLDPRVGDRRRRAVAAAKVAGPVLLAYVLVAANFHRTVGHWNAWFLVQDKYGHGLQNPLGSLWHHLTSWGAESRLPRAAVAQTALLLVIVCVAVTVVVRDRKQLSTAEWACAAVGAAFWLAPLMVGGELSLYRAEALVAPVVVLIARAPTRVIAALVPVAAVVAFGMARLFFDGILI